MINQIQNLPESCTKIITAVQDEMAKVIVGQKTVLDRMIIGLICNQHILLEGVPGLAKTLIVTTLAKIISLESSRIQFTPDLLPADLTGTMIYNPGKGEFYSRKGPIFTNILLADEVNRAPAKVQSALM
jgi:MoxR-like ATPase